MGAPLVDFANHEEDMVTEEARWRLSRMEPNLGSREKMAKGERSRESVRLRHVPPRAAPLFDRVRHLPSRFSGRTTNDAIYRIPSRDLVPDDRWRDEYEMNLSQHRLECRPSVVHHLVCTTISLHIAQHSSNRTRICCLQ